MSDTISDTISESESITSDDVVLSDELQKDFEEVLEQCAEVERLHTHILSTMETVQSAITQSDCIMVTYEGKSQDLHDVLDSIHKKSHDSNLGSMLLSMLETCEFK